MGVGSARTRKGLYHGCRPETAEIKRFIRSGSDAGRVVSALASAGMIPDNRVALVP
jgi:hypothetical protein